MGESRTRVVVISDENAVDLEAGINNAISYYEGARQWVLFDIKFALNDRFAVAVLIFMKG